MRHEIDAQLSGGAFASHASPRSRAPRLVGDRQRHGRHAHRRGAAASSRRICYDITVFGAEPYGNYNRILLSPVLAGEKTVDDIILNTRDWYDENGIRLYAGDPVIAIDRSAPRRCVREGGVEVGYDRLLIATGSKPFLIPVPGHDLPGVIAFRDIQDVETMLEAARNHRHAVVIGGGLLGLGSAPTDMRQGMSVTVVHVMDSLMERQLDCSASVLLQQALERRGLRFPAEGEHRGDRRTGSRERRAFRRRHGRFPQTSS